MESKNNTIEGLKILNKIIVPIGLLASICALIFILILAITPNDVKSPAEFIFPTILFLSSFFGCLWYCRTKLGWFQRKDK